MSVCLFGLVRYGSSFSIRLGPCPAGAGELLSEVEFGTLCRDALLPDRANDRLTAFTEVVVVGFTSQHALNVAWADGR